MQVDMCCCIWFPFFHTVLFIYVKVGWSLQGCWKYCHADVVLHLLAIQPPLNQIDFWISVCAWIGGWRNWLKTEISTMLNFWCILVHYIMLIFQHQHLGWGCCLLPFPAQQWFRAPELPSAEQSHVYGNTQTTAEVLFSRYNYRFPILLTEE